MTIEISDIILLIAAAQGFFLTLLIFHKHRDLYANRFLISIIFLFSILLLHLLLGELGYEHIYPHFVMMIIGIGLLIPPLHYLYARFLVNNDRRFMKIQWLHFLPFLVYEFYCLIYLFYFDDKSLVNLLENELSFNGLLFNWSQLTVGFIYVIPTFRIINRYSVRIKELYSSIEKIKLNWLRNITIMVTIVLIVFLFENILFLFGINFSNNFNLSSFLTAVYVYVLGYLGLFKSEVFAQQEIVSVNVQDYWNDRENKGMYSKSKYEKSGLSIEKSEESLKMLSDLMEKQQPYIKNDLSLNELASMLSLSSHNLSEIINTRLKKNFFDFVNQYRVEKVKSDLIDANKKHLNILAIAFDAGFSSKSSFNSIFKKHTHLTPSEYRRQALKKKN